jgi:hypothetical protein
MQGFLQLQRISRFLLAVAISGLLGTGMALAQSEPTLAQIYATAQAGKLEEAQSMIQQVLISHPNSAKAHFVRSELYARQGKFDLARDNLATAEKIDPAMAFAKPEALQSLRNQIASTGNTAGATKRVAEGSHYQTGSPPSGTVNDKANSWAIALLLAAAVIAAGYFIFRRRTSPVSSPMSSYASFGTQPNNMNPAATNPGGLAGPQTFGMGSNAGTMQNPYPQQAGSGLGGKIMGGVATGLAVGAGMMAADAIGKTLMGDHNKNPGQQDTSANSFTNVNNPDMGGNNFGVNDASSWDDEGSSDSGSGGDWDN